MSVHVRRRGILLAIAASLFLVLSSLLPNSTVLASSASSRAFAAQGSAARSATDIIARAKTWVDANPPVGYSQTPPYYPDPIRGYRRDCSGYVSMAWQLPPPGLTTETLPDVADVITPDDLQPGDVLDNRDGERNGKFAHVVIFVGWANSAHTAYRAYEENGDAGAVFVPDMPYPYWPTNLQGQPNYLSPKDYVPLRLDPTKVSSGKTPVPTASPVRPGGLWISPVAGQTVSDPVHFSAWAYPTHTFDPMVTFVRFSVATQGMWRVACTAPVPTPPLTPVPTPAATPLPAPGAQQFSCDADLGSLGIPSGPIKVSFDVFDAAGNVNLAPNGEHALTYIHIAVVTRTSSTIRSGGTIFGTVSVSCAPGEQLLGGGYDDAGYPDGTVDSSYPSSATTWTLGLGIGYDSSPGPHAVTAYALCLQASFSIGLQIIHTEQTNSLQATASCPPSTTLVGGGFSGGNESHWSFAANNGWTVSYFSESFGDIPGDITAYALCASTVVHVTSPPAANIPNPSGGDAMASVTCLPGTMLIGGGFGEANSTGFYSVDKPSSNGSEWRVTGTSGADPVVAHALCATFSV